jgi:VanZ family protein
MTKINRLITWAEVFAWIGLILFLSGERFGASHTWIALKYWVDLLNLPISPAALPVVHLAMRKAAHFTEFFVLGLLLYRALLGNLKEFRFKAAWWVIGAGLLCALADEAHQMLVVSRTPSLRDSFLDFSGVLASQLCLYLRSHFYHAGFLHAGSEESSASPEESP